MNLIHLSLLFVARAFRFQDKNSRIWSSTMPGGDSQRKAQSEKTKKKESKKRSSQSTGAEYPDASPDDDNTMHADDANSKVKTGGAWRPAAKVAKTDVGAVATASEGCSIALFYAYASPQWTKAKRDDLLERIVGWGHRNNMGGRVRVACEGVNVTVSGTAACLRAFATFLIDFDETVFGKAEFKYIDNMPADRHFKVRVVH